MRKGWRGGSERGATAVEFALVLPLLLIIVFGIIDFGRAINAQITITQAAREGARVDSLAGTLNYTVPDIQTRAQAAAIGLNNVNVNVEYSADGVLADAQAGTCADVTSTSYPNADAVVRVTYKFSFITPVSAIAGLFGSSFGSGMTLTATGVMPCES